MPSRLTFAVAIGAIACGCVSTLERTPISVGGTFRGTTEAGRPIVLTLEEGEGGFSGHGSLDGAPLVIAGATTWSAVASLTHGQGSTTLYTVSLSPDGNRLALERPGAAATELERRGPAVAAAPGPLSGRYRARDDGAAIAEVTVVQNGSLVAGIAVLWGQPAGVSGRVAAGGEARGLLTFADGSQAVFSAVLSADGRQLTVRGLGAPVTLRRR